MPLNDAEYANMTPWVAKADSSGSLVNVNIWNTHLVPHIWLPLNMNVQGIFCNVSDFSTSWLLHAELWVQSIHSSDKFTARLMNMAIVDSGSIHNVHHSGLLGGIGSWHLFSVHYAKTSESFSLFSTTITRRRCGVHNGRRKRRVIYFKLYSSLYKSISIPQNDRNMLYHAALLRRTSFSYLNEI